MAQQTPVELVNRLQKLVQTSEMHSNSNSNSKELRLEACGVAYKLFREFENTTSAMKPEYSRILINDIVLPNKGVTSWPTSSDMAMLALLSSLERSESQCQSLLKSAGLKIVKIWPGIPESVIEAELA